jgi:hypothetical protein
MPANHTLVVHRGHEAEFGPDASIECHGVTETCAEWVECKPECNAAGDNTGVTDDFTAHGFQHRYFDQQPYGFWAVRSGGCYAEGRNDADAVEFAEEQKLSSGRYPVNVEVDDSTVIISFATCGESALSRGSSGRRRHD